MCIPLLRLLATLLLNPLFILSCFYFFSFCICNLQLTVSNGLDTGCLWKPTHSFNMKFITAVSFFAAAAMAAPAAPVCANSVDYHAIHC